MMDLFSAIEQLNPIPIDDGELYFLERLPLAIPSADVLRRLVAETAWRADSVTPSPDRV